MQVDTFEKIMLILDKTFQTFRYDPKDDLLISIWFEELEYMDDAKALLAVKKVISTCEFVSIKALKEAYADVTSPPKVDDSEGWGLVERAIRLFGYSRADEAVASLPPQVQKAVQYMGGFKTICEAEKKEVIRGQFTKAMAAINFRTRTDATLGISLSSQIKKYQELAQSKVNLSIEHRPQEIEDKGYKSGDRVAENEQHIAHIRSILEGACASGC